MCGENKVKGFGRKLAVCKFHAAMVNGALHEEGAERKRLTCSREGEGQASAELQR